MNCSACVCLLWRRSLCCLLSLSSAAPAGFELQLCRPGAAPAAGNVWSLLKRRGSVRTSSAGPASQESWSLFPPCGTFHKRGPANRLHWYQGSVGGPGSGRKRPGGGGGEGWAALSPVSLAPLLVCAACWEVGLRAVCADECRSGHTLCGPVPMGTGVIANSLFLCFLAMLPLLEYWQALGRSDMQNCCQVDLMWEECFPFDFLLCVVTSTLSYVGTQLQWNSLRFSRRCAMLIAWSLCFRARSTPRADRLNLFIGVHNPQVDLQIRFSQMTSG